MFKLATTMVCCALVASACARPPLAIAPSPSVDTSPVSEVSPVTSPASSPTSGPTTAPPTPSRAPVLTITSATFHPGEVGVAYSPVTLAATGGVGAYSWSISVGSLPAGLTVTTGGVVSGTPTAAGTPSFTVRVADTHGGSAIVNRSINVARRLSATPLCAAQCDVEIGCLTVCGRFGSQAGGVGPFRYAVSGGSLPGGMGLSGLSLTNAFPGPLRSPTGAPLPYQFSVTATDAFGVSAAVNATFGVYPHLAFAVATATCTPTLTPYACTTTQLQYTGGTPGMKPRWKVLQVLNANLQPEPLPTGFSITFKAPSVIVTVPSQGANYYGTVTLILTDPNLCAPSTNCPSTGNATLTVRV